MRGDERRTTAGRPFRDRPGEGERITIRIAGRGAVQADRRANRRGLIQAGVRVRPGVDRRDSNHRRRAVDAAVVHDQSHIVVSGGVGNECGPDCRDVGQDGVTGRGSADERPAERERLSVRIAGGAAIQRHGDSDEHGLIGASVRHRRCVGRAATAGNVAAVELLQHVGRSHHVGANRRVGLYCIGEPLTKRRQKRVGARQPAGDRLRIGAIGDVEPGGDELRRENEAAVSLSRGVEERQ